MIDFLLIVLVFLAILLAVGSIRKSRKKGKSCMGCPYEGSCYKKDCGKKE